MPPALKDKSHCGPSSECKTAENPHTVGTPPRPSNSPVTDETDGRCHQGQARSTLGSTPNQRLLKNKAISQSRNSSPISAPRALTWHPSFFPCGRASSRGCSWSGGQCRPGVLVAHSSWQGDMGRVGPLPGLTLFILTDEQDPVARLPSSQPQPPPWPSQGCWCRLPGAAPGQSLLWGRSQLGGTTLTSCMWVRDRGPPPESL